MILDDGLIFKGRSFAHPALSIDELAARAGELNPRGLGELVFTTSMSGYVEMMSDPSYTGQIVCCAYPLIGNYGVDASWQENNPASNVPPISVAGLALHELYRGPVTQKRKTLETWMLEHSIPGIEGIETRTLTQHLRDTGAKNAALLQCSSDNDIQIEKALSLIRKFPAMEGRNLVSITGKNEWEEYNPRNSAEKLCTVVLYNCGTKQNIVRMLLKRNCHVYVAPSTTSAEAILQKDPDMVLVSNGPGDPAELGQQIALLHELQSRTVLCGICLGNQLLALSLGARTYKMSFGHHGSNHPVQETMSKKLFITSQNHGFAIEEASLPKGAQVWFKNVNDGTVEGFMCPEQNIYSVQFHPEACPGPQDADWIFNFFVERAIDFRNTWKENV